MREKIAMTAAYLESIISRLKYVTMKQTEGSTSLQDKFQTSKAVSGKYTSLITDDYIDTALYKIYQKIHSI
jgi:hypothetical protein